MTRLIVISSHAKLAAASVLVTYIKRDDGVHQAVRDKARWRFTLITTNRLYWPGKLWHKSWHNSARIRKCICPAPVDTQCVCALRQCPSASYVNGKIALAWRADKRCYVWPFHWFCLLLPDAKRSLSFSQVIHIQCDGVCHLAAGAATWPAPAL